MKRLPLLFTFLAVVALSASIAYWGLQFYKPPQRALVAAPVASLPEPAVDAAASLFGGGAAVAVASNYQLTGVVAAGRGSDSVAIIVADGKPPKAVKVGREVVPGVTVQEVRARYVLLSEGGVAKRIELATDAKAGATATAGAPPAPNMVAEPQMPPPGAQPPPPPAPPVRMAPPVRTVVTPPNVQPAPNQ